MLKDHKLKLRPNFCQSRSLQHSCGKSSGLLPVIFRRAPNELPNPFGESPSNFDEIPPHCPNLDRMLKLDLGPSSGCNFIASVIVRPA
ncbi:hypothetical protein BHE74_00032001 [Ensete ventricosum]|nr:hypothetical protein GW17_00014884 [Ensete ventricosum]RWW60966.1 hypothetical protein BHE74_00032001 [Ensete ventricosum]